MTHLITFRSITIIDECSNNVKQILVEALAFINRILFNNSLRSAKLAYLANITQGGVYHRIWWPWITPTDNTQIEAMLTDTRDVNEHLSNMLTRIKQINLCIVDHQDFLLTSSSHSSSSLYLNRRLFDFPPMTYATVFLVGVVLLRELARLLPNVPVPHEPYFAHPMSPTGPALFDGGAAFEAFLFGGTIHVDATTGRLFLLSRDRHTVSLSDSNIEQGLRFGMINRTLTDDRSMIDNHFWSALNSSVDTNNNDDRYDPRPKTVFEIQMTRCGDCITVD